ncbi:hypothetical protein PpBr36_04458 [Pyricularia pennisetigena]|uniref:hypothetical protein n=1 Tax=Pyricularia pennisetigena TaxID=1578925 RepID=UPI00115465FE|nr:hypothetical protein PpBr36_04458 [Pyricularia pennisetigena]TLS27693.1 hypothetical protein PpBr36_04458 [Pyricularia pennisetigena]
MSRPTGHLMGNIFGRCRQVASFFRSIRALSHHSGQLGELHPMPQTRTFTTSWLSMKQMPLRPKPPPETEIEEAFLKGSGPGGQKINKTNSAVQLKHIPTGIVIKCQETRSRDQNRKIARQILATRLDDLHNGDQSRSAIVGAHKLKKRASAAKKSARKYRKLEAEKNKEANDNVDDIAEASITNLERGRGQA